MARVLLVDDDESARGVLEAILRYDGHEVVLAANGKQALFVLRQEPADIVLSDINMPGMSGTEFCRELRGDEDLRETWVILATGVDSPDSRSQAIAAGADDFVGKPVRADELNARLRLAARMRGLHREIAALKRRVSERDRASLDLESLAARITRLRGDLAERLGTALDLVRAAAEECRRGELPPVLEALGKIEASIQELRAQAAPREAPPPKR